MVEVRLSEQSHALHRKIEGIGYGFVIPFLFTIGMKTTASVAAWENAAIVGATVLCR